ncbi:MAG: dihydrodipicolinate synthase family protein [Pseudorhodoplanes sp.]
MKDITESRAHLRGIFNIAVTPFRKDGSFDHDGLAANIERMIGLEYDGILIGGTYGEFAAMSTNERADLFRHAMAVAGDRIPVMLCSAASDVRIARELTALAGQLGGLPMMTPPFMTEITDAQVIAFFKDMAAQSKTGILIYNAPRSGTTISPDLLDRLADIPGVVGAKQGDLSPLAIDQTAGRLAGKIKIFCASDLSFLGPVMAGFDGLTSTNSCALPELILTAFRAAQSGDARIATELHQLWYPLRTLTRRFGQPQTTKAAMNVRGFAGGSVRPPLTDLDGNELETVRSVINALSEDCRSGVAA